MTVDEIKARYTMRDVLAQYGLTPNRAGFISCPFHNGDHTASMKIYEHSFSCFGCHRGGDVIRFVELMEHCDFKTAFFQLGGTYESIPKQERESNAALFRQRKEERRLAEERQKQAKAYMVETITMIQDTLDNAKPLSDLWCLAQNYKPQILDDWQAIYIEDERGDRLKNAIRRCRQFRREYADVSRTIQ